MAKGKRHGAIQHTSATPPPVGVPAEAPARPLDADEADTKAVKLTNPHAVGADRTARIKAHLAAVQAKEAARKAARGKLPAPAKPAKRKKKAAKPAATTELY
jgi:hypothetical protein